MALHFSTSKESEYITLHEGEYTILPYTSAQLPTCQSDAYIDADEPTYAYIYYRVGARPHVGGVHTRAYLWVASACHLAARLMYAIYH